MLHLEERATVIRRRPDSSTYEDTTPTEGPTITVGSNTMVQSKLIPVVAWSILLISIALFVAGLAFFPSTAFGFAMTFGGGILGIEAFLLIRKWKATLAHT